MLILMNEVTIKFVQVVEGVHTTKQKLMLVGINFGFPIVEPKTHFPKQDNLAMVIRMKKQTNRTKQPTRKRCEVYSRIVGYLRPIDQWNDGKSQEYKDRKEFKVDKK